RIAHPLFGAPSGSPTYTGRIRYGTHPGASRERSRSMGHLFRGIRRLILAATLTLASLTGTTLLAPAAHASGGPSLPPMGQGGGVYVEGQGFTPGVPVRVEVLNSGLTIVGSKQYLTPKPGYYGGWFATVLPAGFTGGAWVAADQAGHSTTWAATTIYHDPY